MRSLIVLVTLICSISSFAKCIRDYAYADNKGIYTWCEGDSIIHRDEDTKKYHNGKIIHVSQKVSQTWNYNTVIIKLDNGKEIETGGRFVYKTSGCRLYLVNEGWSSRKLCVGGKTKFQTMRHNSNRTKAIHGPFKIIGIGFKTLLLDMNGQLIITSNLRT